MPNDLSVGLQAEKARMQLNCLLILFSLNNSFIICKQFYWFGWEHYDIGSCSGHYGEYSIQYWVIRWEFVFFLNVRTYKNDTIAKLTSYRSIYEKQKRKKNHTLYKTGYNKVKKRV